MRKAIIVGEHIMVVDRDVIVIVLCTSIISYDVVTTRVTVANSSVFESKHLVI